ncbi:DUF559 domain-containing protein [Smaragdicoccus niigatensis]|uniref:DUF559 domain-containing protein n=1 Tax=Smaragdicoccus niigatensis TaxID=359359 RepID=UPI00036F6850|nr:DUF559 domain-containing protein [Smaragdicoccus niigatensis]
MDQLGDLIKANGGVVSAAQLREAGIAYSDIRQLRDFGWMTIRRGWYQAPGASESVVAAVKKGAAVSCVSALEKHGVWVPETTRTHIRFPGKGKRRYVNCRPYRSSAPVHAAVDSIDLAVGAALNCLDREGVLVVLDSMLNQKIIAESDARTFLTASRFRHLDLADHLDRKSESGLETMVRVRLRALQIHLRTQVTIGDIGRVDLLIGTSLVIETDGWDTHKGKRQQDVKRDRRLLALGYVVIRLTYDDVVHQWNESLEDILAVVRRRGHLKLTADRPVV